MGARDIAKKIPGIRPLVRGIRSLRSRAVPTQKSGQLQYNDRPQSLGVLFDLWSLSAKNRFSRRSIVDPAGSLVVSTTTHGRRLARAYLAIESVGRGESRPRRHLLWLDDPALYSSRPQTIRRLEKRGLEVHLVPPGLKVHTKYWPYVDQTANHVHALVLCDDDIVYPRTWLRHLADRAVDNRGLVVAYRTHTIRLDNESIAPYATWTPTGNAHPSFLHFPTAVSGTLYPVELLEAARQRGLDFLVESPMNDDIWLHALAVHHGIRTVQVGARPEHFPFVPGTQASGLYMTNIGSGENDRQIAKSYSRAAISRLVEESRRSAD